MTAAAGPGLADEAEDLRKLRDSTISLVNALVDQGVLTRAKADAIIAQAMQAGAKPPAPGAPGAPPPAAGAAKTPAAPGAAAQPPAAASATPATPPPAAPGVVRVPYVPESVKEEIRDEVKQDVLAQAKTERWGNPGAFPDWLNHFTLYGDIRIRGQADRYPTDNTPNAPVAVLNAYGVNIANSTQADNLLRVRARFGLEASVGDTVTVGMRLATGGVGNGSNPGSENQTLGNYLSRSSVGFDRAYLAYHPEAWLTFTGGRMGNPYFKPTTLIWADDVSLEGLAVQVNPQFGPHWALFSTAGAYPMLQNDPTPTSDAKSKWLYAYQAGFEWRLSQIARWRLAAALYDYRNIEGIPNPTIESTAYNATAAPFRQTGNTVFDINGLLDTEEGTQANLLYGLASKFHEANLSTTVDLGFIGDTHVLIEGDWVRNLGFNEGNIFQRTGYLVDKQTTGWQTQVTVGHLNMARKFNWQAWLGYRYVERDATVDAFTDQNFHLGGTDAKGYYLGGSFAFEKNSFVSLRWFSAKQIDGVELAGADSVLSGLPLAIDVLQLDIMSSF
jgi:hypothetical protein